MPHRVVVGMAVSENVFIGRYAALLSLFRGVFSRPMGRLASSTMLLDAGHCTQKGRGRTVLQTLLQFGGRLSL